MDTKNLFQTILKYVIPVFFFVLAVWLINKGSQKVHYPKVTCGTEKVQEAGDEEAKLKDKLESWDVEQTAYFKYAGFVLLAMAIGMALFIANVINRTVALIVLPALLVGAAWMLVLSVQTVDKINEWGKQKEKIYSETKQRLLDIKEAMVEYKNVHNEYPPDLDALIEFVKNGEVYSIYREGDPPDREVTEGEAFRLWAGDSTQMDVDWTDSTAAAEYVMNWLDTTSIVYGDSMMTEKMAHTLGYIIRDTIYMPVVEKLFTGVDAKPRRSRWDFAADSMKYMAYTKDTLTYATLRINMKGPEDSVDRWKHRFEVRLTHPWQKNFSDTPCEERDELIMGSLEEDKISGNWKK